MVKKLLLFALVLGAAGCSQKSGIADAAKKSEPEATHVAAPAASSVAGYTQSGSDVVFTFDPANMVSYTDGSSNELVDVKTVQIQKVAIAGEFNGWSSDANPMELKGTVWTTTLKTSELGTGQVPFKFVVNGQYWVEPPATATNTLDNGMGNGGKNYIYTAK